jgi:predicted O-methyltransferase YrrM
MTGKTLGLEGPLYDYYAAHAYREPEILKELRLETAKLGGDARMQIGPEQGAFMAMLVKLMGAKRILEIGTFTGYSSLAMALAGDAKIIAADVSEAGTAAVHRVRGPGRRADLVLAERRLDDGRAAVLGEGAGQP